MITLQEMKQRQYEAQNRKGYQKDLMDDLLEDIYTTIKELQQNNDKLNDTVKTLSSGIQYYKSIEQTLQKALILAEKTAKETKDAAVLRAETIEKEATNKADSIISTAKEETEHINAKCAELVKKYNQFKLQYKQVASAQLDMLNSESFEIFAPDMNAIYQKSERKALIDNENHQPSTINQEEIPTGDTVAQKQAVLSSEDLVELQRKEFHERAMKLREIEQEKQEMQKSNEVQTAPVEKAAPVPAAKPQPIVNPAVEPIKVPVEATDAPLADDLLPLDQLAAKKNEEKAKVEPEDDEQSLDYLLRDLDIASTKEKKDEEEDPFEFLGSLDDC